MKIVFSIWFCFIFSLLNGQFQIEGYVYESANRGFIDGATIQLYNLIDPKPVDETISNENGAYFFNLENHGEYLITVEKPPFIEYSEKVNIASDSEKKVFLRHEISRKPGYTFEITLAEKNDTPNQPRAGLKGCNIEMYNNTKKRAELVLDNLQFPEFKVDFVKGNHYTILIRKDGYITRRLESYVDVQGCILCFEGVGQVTPGVADNLNANNTMGVLLANLEMEKYHEGKVIQLNDIEYETGRSRLTQAGEMELVKVSRLLKDNPEIIVELGSHTDSRGTKAFNLSLSEKRASAAVSYLVKDLSLNPDRIFAKGYGELQLTNKCSDDVICTEQEHSANRRTELKIIGIDNNLAPQSLRQMKAEELLDEILLELDQEGQIQVPADGSLDEAIAQREQNRNLENKPSKSLNNQGTILSAGDENDHQVENEKQSDSIGRSPSIKVLSVNETGEAKAEISENVKSENTKGVHSQSRSPSSRQDDKIDKKDAEFTGYKIVLLFSRYELSKDHPLFMKFQDLDVYTTADGNKLYMIESHDDRNKAELRLNQRFISSFPNAYVVGFENGIITD